MERVQGVLEALSKDALLQMDLKDPEVIAAIDHWTGKTRLSTEEASRFEENYRVMQVMGKLQRLQAECREAGIGVPIKALLAGSTDPYYGVPKATSSKDIPKMPAAVPMEEPPEMHVDNKAQAVTGTRSMLSEQEQEEIQGLETWLELSFLNIAQWWAWQFAFLGVAITHWSSWELSVAASSE